jgi:hypothetical protein
VQGDDEEALEQAVNSNALYVGQQAERFWAAVVATRFTSRPQIFIYKWKNASTFAQKKS